MKLICLWCLKSEDEVTFDKKAHTIPKSLGGQKYNNNVCDSCNEYFGSKNEQNYSIEEALKEGLNISRQRFLNGNITKRQIGRFKSRFFEIKMKSNGKHQLYIKPSFRFSKKFQQELAHSFKRGLYKMYFEELNRQKGLGYESEYNVVRNFARYNQGNPPVLYFERRFGMFIMFAREAETPILYLQRMNYLLNSKNYAEIEFLGHVFGFPIADISTQEYIQCLTDSQNLKKDYFKGHKIIDKLIDIDIAMKIMND